MNTAHEQGTRGRVGSYVWATPPCLHATLRKIAKDGAPRAFLIRKGSVRTAASI